jgi:hypothetical protein
MAVGSAPPGEATHQALAPVVISITLNSPGKKKGVRKKKRRGGGGCGGKQLEIVRSLSSLTKPGVFGGISNEPMSKPPGWQDPREEVVGDQVHDVINRCPVLYSMSIPPASVQVHPDGWWPPVSGSTVTRLEDEQEVVRPKSMPSCVPVDRRRSVPAGGGWEPISV